MIIKSFVPSINFRCEKSFQSLKNILIADNYIFNSQIKYCKTIVSNYVRIDDNSWQESYYRNSILWHVIIISMWFRCIFGRIFSAYVLYFLFYFSLYFSSFLIDSYVKCLRFLTLECIYQLPWKNKRSCVFLDFIVCDILSIMWSDYLHFHDASYYDMLSWNVIHCDVT